MINNDILSPDIFQYWDYRKYLEDYFTFQKEIRPAFSHRFFCKKAGFKSSGALGLIISGKRNLSMTSAILVAEAMGLAIKGKSCFVNLTLFNQATTEKEKKKYEAELLKLKEKQNVAIQETSLKQYKFYSEWYHTVIREMIELPNAESDPAWFANRIYPKISTHKVAESLQLLESLEMIKKDKNGKLTVSHAAITTPNEVASEAVANFNREMVHLALDASMVLPKSEREVSGMTLRISSAGFQQMKSRIIEFKRELLELAVLDEPADKIYQLNFQLFPLICKK